MVTYVGNFILHCMVTSALEELLLQATKGYLQNQNGLGLSVPELTSLQGVILQLPFWSSLLMDHPLILCQFIFKKKSKQSIKCVY